MVELFAQAWFYRIENAWTQQLPDAELSNGVLVSAPDVTGIPGEAESWPEQVLGVSSSIAVTEWGDLEKPCKWLNKIFSQSNMLD